MNERDEDRRIEEKLQRWEQADREERARAQATDRPRPSQASERRQDREAEPAPPDVEALVRSFRAELDDMEGRTVAAIDAVAERVASVPGAAQELAEWVRRAAARSEAVDRLTPLLEEAVDRQNRLHRPARRRARMAGYVLVLTLTAVLAIAAQWRFEIVETPDPTARWRDHLWERYGAELRDCVIRADSQGKAMLCRIFDPEPELP